MSKLNNVRKISIIGDSEVGKTTLINALVNKAKMVSNSSNMSFELDDQLLGDLNLNGNEFHIDLIDLPDGTDIEHDVDGALIVIDAVRGVSPQTEKLLCQALTQRIELALVINQIDRCILLEMLNTEELYQRFVSIISQCNALVATYRNTEQYFDPKKGNVMFASGKHGWGFTLPQYVRLLVLLKKTNISAIGCIQRLWGDWFHSTRHNKWIDREHAKTEYRYENVKRDFTAYVLEYFYHMIHVCDNRDIHLIKKISNHIHLQLPIEKLDINKYNNDQIMLNVMNNWLPITEAMLHLIILHLPSPIQAQIFKDTHTQ